MAEVAGGKWEPWMSLLAPLVTIIGIIVGVWQFNEGENSRRELSEESLLQQDEIEFRRKLWLEKLNSCRDITNVAGLIASSKSNSARSKAIDDFRSSYWGAMIVNEDKIVEGAMIDLEVELRDLENNDSSQERIKARVAALGFACRSSLQAGTPVNLARGLQAQPDRSVSEAKKFN